MRLLLVDRILKITEISIKAEKYLTLNEKIYEYHFPGNPVLPAAFMVEASIQLGRIFIWRLTDYKYTLLPLEFLKFKFKKVLSPGTILIVQIDFNDKIAAIIENEQTKVRVIGTNDNSTVFEGSMICRLAPFDALHDLSLSKKYVDYLTKGKYE